MYTPMDAFLYIVLLGIGLFMLMGVGAWLLATALDLNEANKAWRNRRV